MTSTRRSASQLTASAAANALVSGIASVALLALLRPHEWAAIGSALLAVRVAQPLVVRTVAPAAVLSGGIFPEYRRLQARVGYLCSVGVVVYCAAVAIFLQSPAMLLLGVGAGLAVLGLSTRALRIALLESQFRYGRVALAETVDSLCIPLAALALALVHAPLWTFAIAFLLRASLPSLVLAVGGSPGSPAPYAYPEAKPVAVDDISRQSWLFAIAVLMPPLAAAVTGDADLLGVLDASLLILAYALLPVQITARLMLNLSARGRKEEVRALFAVNALLSTGSLVCLALIGGSGLVGNLSPRWQGADTMVLDLVPAFAFASIELPLLQAFWNARGRPERAVNAQGVGLVTLLVGLVVALFFDARFIPLAMTVQFAAAVAILRVRSSGDSFEALSTTCVLSLYAGAAAFCGARWFHFAPVNSVLSWASLAFTTAGASLAAVAYFSRSQGL